jgi:hypothetical protein
MIFTYIITCNSQDHPTVFSIHVCNGQRIAESAPGLALLAQGCSDEAVGVGQIRQADLFRAPIICNRPSKRCAIIFFTLI